MLRDEFVSKLFAEGDKRGLVDMEVYFAEGDSFDIEIFEGEITRYSLSTEGGLSFRAIYKGEMGYSYTEKYDEDSIRLLLKGAVENAEITDREDKESLFGGSPKYEKVDAYNAAWESVSEREKIDIALALEAEAKKLDKRVFKVQVYFGSASGETSIKNTAGLDVNDKSNMGYAYVSVVVKDGENVQTGSDFIFSTILANYDVSALAEKAVSKGISMLEAKPCKTGEYAVILDNLVSANILSAYSGMFSAESVHKGLSLLAGKLNEKIATDIVTIVDDPLMANGAASASFDGEGVAAKYLKIIEKGKLLTYLHNRKTAEKDGVESTGNAGKPSYKAPVVVSPTNMYIVKGEKTQEEMISDMGSGLLITSVQGLHAGINPVSGDFSLSASGYMIEDGKKGRAVNQITIAGNYLSLLSDVAAVGCDLRFGLPDSSSFGSPSINITKLNVAGE